MRVDAAYSTNNMHFHAGSTCHGFPTKDECIKHALSHGWVGKVLEKTDNMAKSGEEVKCYSLIVAGFDHWGKKGVFVAEIKNEAKVENLHGN